MKGNAIASRALCALNKVQQFVHGFYRSTKTNVQMAQLHDSNMNPFDTYLSVYVSSIKSSHSICISAISPGILVAVAGLGRTI